MKTVKKMLIAHLLTLSLTLALGTAGWWLGARRVSPAPTVQPVPAVPAPAPASSNSGAEADRKSGTPETGAAEHSALEAEYLELLKLAPEKYPDRLRRAFQQGNQDEIKWLAERWAERNPASLLTFMQSADGLGFRVDYWPDWTITQACFGAWFRKDMAGAIAAMERLRRFSPDMGRMSSSAWPVIFPMLMRNSPARALQFLTEHPDFGGGLIISSQEYRDLAPLAAGMPACAGRSRLLRGVFSAFLNGPDPEKGREAGLAWLAKLDPVRRMEAVPPAGELEGKEKAAMRDLLRNAFSPADLEALEAAPEGPGDPDRIPQLARLRALQDPRAAMAWASALRGSGKFTAMAGILEISAPDKPEGAAAFLESFPAGPLHDRALHTIVENLRSAGDWRVSADWLLSLADARDTRTGILQMAGNWALNRPADCAAWVSALPEGPLRLRAASAAVDGVRSDADKLAMAARLPEGLGVEALNHSWAGITKSDSRPLAEAAAGQPPGPIRGAAMAKASKDSRIVFNGFTQAWLDWANALPTPADRAAAWRGAEERGDTSRWDDGVREKARRQLSGESL